MTTINSQEDFLRALSENPEWRAAVRAQILGDELLQLPAKFDAFVEEQKQFNAMFTGFIEEQKQFNAMFVAFIEEQKQFNAMVAGFIEEQKQFNAMVAGFIEEQKRFNFEMKAFVAAQEITNDRLARNLERIAHDIGQLRGWFARLNAAEFAPVIAYEMGMRLVRSLPRAELMNMAHDAVSDGIPRDSLRSFINADVIIEATQPDGSICYIAVEASYTADHRDADRALRNADFLTRFTGIPARPAIVSVRNDRELAPDVLQGNVFWYPIPDQFWEPE